MKKLFSLLMLNAFVYTLNAQSNDTTTAIMRCDNKEIIDRTSEIVRKYREQGFIVFQGGFYQLENNSLMPIMVNLIERTAYCIIVVGQPDLRVLEVGLGHDAFGVDEIRDVIRGNRDEEYYTYFSYVPSFTGNYLLSIRERLHNKKKFCTAVYIMVKPNAISE